MRLGPQPASVAPGNPTGWAAIQQALLSARSGTLQHFSSSIDAQWPLRSRPQAKWRRLEQLHERFAPFRDASIDRWHRKTLLSGGNAGALQHVFLGCIMHASSCF